MVRQAWIGGTCDDMAVRVERCGTDLSGWAATTFGDIKKRIKKKEDELELWQNKAPDGAMMGKCREIVHELDELNRLHESYWFARARANEMKDGDKNTAYFHHKVSQRKHRNLITKIQDSAGEWQTDEEEVGRVIHDYFSKMFSSSMPSDFESALVGIEK